ncbi:hypothetical protein C0992_003640 [Termitomyces sp. T32_za158]|nr:hypothetical protein C0992_003640 [Termitomyces sp. T32_za158]
MSSPPEFEGSEYDSDEDVSRQMMDVLVNSGIPDASPLLAELTPEQFPLHFDERDGRLFHSHHSSPYPLPVDTPEQERLKVTHVILYRLIGANYVGPVSEALAPTPERQRLVLDLCTGSGKWVMEMASEFPHVQFRGIDIVPIATRYPLPNVQFEIHDVNTPWRWRTASVDMVHARSVSMAVLDYAAVLQEVGRVLRPNGLFVSYEWGRYPAFHPAMGLNPSEHAPGVCQFFAALTQALAVCRGIQHVAGTLPALLTAAGCFRDVTARQYFVPIGPWHEDPRMKEIGRGFRATLSRYADSVKPLLMDAGWTEEEVAAIAQAYLHDLRTVPGLVAVLHTVHAQKI